MYEMIVGLKIKDEEVYAEYRKRMSPLLEKFGGGFRYDFHVSKVLKNEEGRPINRVFAIYCSDQESMNNFFEDTEYKKIKQKYFINSVEDMTIISKHKRLDMEKGERSMESKTIESLKWRYATKSFDTSKELSDEQVNVLTESLRLSASSFGLQPWKFVIVKDKSIQKTLREHSWNQAQIEEASHLIVLCGKTDVGPETVDKFVASTAEIRGVSVESISDYSNMMKGFISRMDEEKKSAWIKNQVYIALGTLLTVAAAEGIDSCPVEGFISEKYDEILGLKDKNLKSVVVCPVGVRSSDDKYADLSKVRFPIEEVIVKI